VVATPAAIESRAAASAATPCAIASGTAAAPELIAAPAAIASETAAAAATPPAIASGTAAAAATPDAIAPRSAAAAATPDTNEVEPLPGERGERALTRADIEAAMGERDAVQVRLTNIKRGRRPRDLPKETSMEDAQKDLEQLLERKRLQLNKLREEFKQQQVASNVSAIKTNTDLLPDMKRDTDKIPQIEARTADT